MILEGHSKRVGILAWHPTAFNILLTAGNVTRRLLGALVWTLEGTIWDFLHNLHKLCWRVHVRGRRVFYFKCKSTLPHNTCWQILAITMTT